MNFHFNHVFAPVFTTNKRYIDIYGGRGRGGSHFGTDYFLFLITQPYYFRGYFIRQAFNDIRDSLFADFKDRINENEDLSIEDFHINENEMRITYIPTGNRIASKGMKKEGNRTAKMKSLAGATHVLIEETDEVGEEDFDQLDLSLRTVKNRIQIIRIFNPPFKQHWIWRDYNLTDAPKPLDWPEDKFPYYIAKPKQESQVCGVYSTYLDNLKNNDATTVTKYESFRVNRPEYYYTTIKGYVSEGQKGRIFKNWQVCNQKEWQSVDALPACGLDFGAITGGLVEIKIYRNRLYLRQLFYGGGTDKEIGIKLCILKVSHDETIVADSAEPGMISKLRQGWTSDELTQEEIDSYPGLLKGWNVFGVKKYPGYRAQARKKIMDYEVFATEDSADLWNEYREHKWALDKNKNPTDEPEDGNDHLIDPTCYAVTSKGVFY